MEKDDAVVYSTLPLGIIVTDKHIITVCLKESSILKDMQDGLVRGAETQKRTSFILHMLLQVAKRYLQYLKQIDKIYNYMERQLYKSQRNKELIQLLDLEKSLVYFNTSLKANEVTLEKILRGRILKLYEEGRKEYVARFGPLCRSDLASAKSYGQHLFLHHFRHDGRVCLRHLQ